MTDLPDDAPPPASARGRLIAAAVPLVVGAAALVNSFLLGLGSFTDPGAGLWPAGASGMMILGSVLLLTRFRSVDDGERFNGIGLRTIGFSLVFAGLFVILFGGMGSWPGTGFEWATALMLALWLKLIGRESWLMTAAVSVGVTAGLHLLFIELLKAPIPHTIG
jgi:putative tricarboxylic transport membrane protein